MTRNGKFGGTAHLDKPLQAFSLMTIDESCCNSTYEISGMVVFASSTGYRLKHPVKKVRHYTRVSSIARQETMLGSDFPSRVQTPTCRGASSSNGWANLIDSCRVELAPVDFAESRFTYFSGLDLTHEQGTLPHVYK